MQSTPVNNPKHAMCLNNLGAALHGRFKKTGSIEDLNHAINIGEQAIEYMPIDDPNCVATLTNLGNALLSRFERRGLGEDIDRVIMMMKKAMESMPIDPLNHANMLGTMGSALQRRFERTGSIEDLNHAIKASEQAVKLTPVDLPDRTTYLNSLGSALHRRFERTGLMEDLTRAIETSEEAVESMPMNHPNRGATLTNLCMALQRRFEERGSTDDFDRALASSEQGVDAAMDHLNRGIYFNNRGIILWHQFERTGSMDDLDHVIVNHEQAVQSVPMDHPNRALYLYNLGSALQSRFERRGSIHDRDSSIIIYEQGANSDTATPSVRLKAAQACEELLISQRMLKRAKLILETAVRILPKISPRQLGRSDAQFNISQFVNLTARAVSLSLENKDDPYKALKLMELGRGILANLQLEVRSDISELAAEHPELARQFQQLRNQIDSPSRTSELGMIEDQVARVNSDSNSATFISKGSRTVYKQFEDLLEYIRSLPGFENFLQGPSEVELRSLAKGGAIVVFNVSDIRSDAFLITPDQIRSVPLPLITHF